MAAATQIQQLTTKSKNIVHLVSLGLRQIHTLHTELSLCVVL